MTLMRTLSRHATTAAAALLVTALACRDQDVRRAAVSSDLEQDLAQARATSLELAPAGRKTEVVSAVERVPAGTRAESPQAAPRQAQRQPQHQPAQPRAPRSAEVTPTPAPTPAPAPVASTQSESATDAGQGAPAPRPQPAPAAPSAQGRRGGYKSVGEVIRDAPFPINP
jgi:hypothetical protein